MKKILAAAAIVAMTLPTVAFTDAAAGPGFTPSGDEVQTIDGSIASPTRFTDLEGGWPGLGRRVHNCSHGANGGIAYITPIDAEAIGGAFVIDNVVAAATTRDINTGEEQEADIDVFFYSELADCGGQGTPTTVGEYAAGGPGEVGFVPAGTRYAVIFTPTAINVTFTMRTWAPPVIDMAGTDLDLTIASGATVVWENTTDTYLQIRSEAAGFDSGSGPASGLRSGETFSHTFEVFFGDASFGYDITDDAGIVIASGTITVASGPGGGAPSA